MPHLALAVITALALCGLLFAVRRRAPLLSNLRRSQAAWVLGLALPAGLACQLLLQRMWGWTGLGARGESSSESASLLAALVFAAPLVEGAKVLCVWPLYRARRILSVRQGAALGIVVGLGFAVADLAWTMGSGAPRWEWLLATLCAPAHAACAVAWCCCLGLRGRSSWFAIFWTSGMLTRGLHDHFVWGRGPGFLILALPLLTTCVGLAYASFRRALAREMIPTGFEAGAPDVRISGWSEPPSVREVWRALHPKEASLTLPWVAVGALVTTGVCLVSLAAALYLGQSIGLDFASADEADVRSNGPLLFLAAALALGFPISGYLVARASSSVGVLEPALGSALAVLGAVLLLSITTPVAAVFALAITPIAFALSSGGAWFALDR